MMIRLTDDLESMTAIYKSSNLELSNLDAWKNSDNILKN